jgi:mRNA interferase MazF
MNNSTIKRGDLYYAYLNPVIGSEQGDTRPVLIIQNNMGNEFSPTLIIAPLTGNLRKNPLPTHVQIPCSAGIDRESLVLLEQIRAIDRSRIYNYIGRIGDRLQNAVDKALAVCIGLEKHRSYKGEILELSLCIRCESDFRNSGYLLVKKGWQKTMAPCDFCKIYNGLNFGIFNPEADWRA